ISRWDVEGMRQNTQTGLMENRTIGFASGMSLKKVSDKRLDITGSRRYLGQGFDFFAGDIWAIVFKLPTSDFCHVSIKADFSPFAGANPFGDKLVPVPYLYGSDEYSDQWMPGIMGMPGIADVLNQPENYEYF